jgi:hypothetical protein
MGAGCQVNVEHDTQNGNTYMPPAFATASRSSRDGCEFWWKRFSNMMSWVLVNRFRVRRDVLIVTVLELIDAPSSSDEKLLDEDVRERAIWGRIICRWGTRQNPELSCIYTTNHKFDQISDSTHNNASKASRVRRVTDCVISIAVQDSKFRERQARCGEWSWAHWQCSVQKGFKNRINWLGSNSWLNVQCSHSLLQLATNASVICFQR